MMLVDSHCHLDFSDYAEDRAAVIARAREAGVGTLLTINTEIAAADGVLAVAEGEADIWCSVGIHPHNVTDAAEYLEKRALKAWLLERAAHPKVIGIGETGLDYYYEHSPRDLQRRSFALHMDAARESGLPLIVHTRDADTDTLAQLAEGQAAGPFPGLIHCFSSGRKLAEKAIEMGFYISISGIVTFTKAEALREVVADLPLERLLVETDAPYLAPAPRRGKRNEPAFVAHTAAKVAELKGISMADLAAATSDNFFRLFRKASPPERP